jgi:nitrite reductase/ring-hydroxylating ferredoxin subunit
MRQFKFGKSDKQQVLVAKFKGDLYAISNRCPASNEKLSDGMLFDDKIISPSGASYCLTNGMPE